MHLETHLTSCEGMKEGLEKGIKEGIEEERKKNIQGMKNEGIPVETIAKITGLSLDEIEAI